MCKCWGELYEKGKKINKEISITKYRIIELKNKIISSLMEGNEEQNRKISQEIKLESEKLKKLNDELIKINEEIIYNDDEISKLKEFIPNWSKEFENAPLEVKRNILDRIVDKVYLYNERVEIQVKYPISKMIIKESI